MGGQGAGGGEGTDGDSHNSAYARLFENCRDAVDEQTLDGSEPVLRRVKPSFATRFGYDAAAVSGESLDDWIGPTALAAAARDNWKNVSADWVELELSVPEDVTVEADPSRLMTVFENLLANACQHNEPPLSIRVGTLDPVEQESPREIRGFFVEDDGVSLPLSEEIFEYGYTDSTDGTGLGLAIVQEIVEAHGWSISLVDVPDGGARFEILLDEPGSVS